MVWDALFADSITLDLVDYIFVAMLLYIRDARTFRLLLKENLTMPCGFDACRCEIVWLKGLISVYLLFYLFQ